MITALIQRLPRQGASATSPRPMTDDPKSIPDTTDPGNAEKIVPPTGPNNRWRHPLDSTWDRLRAWANTIFVDHAFFRLVYLNLHRLSPRAWRAAQPLPHQISRLARRGLRSVVTLRGGKSFGSLPLEIEACKAADIHFETFRLRSRAAPTREEIEGAVALFQRLEYPVLFHCKSGADRAGMMSALFLALHEGEPVSVARKQLSLRYGHFRQSKTGILDAFFDSYLADHPDEQVPLLDWVRNDYDSDALTQAFSSGGIGDFLIEKVLRRE